MLARIGPDGDLAGQPGDDDHDGYGASAHVGWLLHQPDFETGLRLAREQASVERAAGRAWREYPTGAIDADGDRIDRWGGAQRRLARVLPPKVRRLIPVFVYGPNRVLMIPRGQSLESRRVERLQRCCLRSLETGPVSAADREFMRRALAILDPPQRPLVKQLLAPDDPPLARFAVAGSDSVPIAL